MISIIKSCSFNGGGTEVVNVECDIFKAMPYISIVGLADVSVKESKERLHSAILNTGFEFPLDKRITINLSPAGTKKEGTHFDLAMALALLLCSNDKCEINTDEYAVIGELSLDGKVNGVPRALPICIGLKQSGINRIIIPRENISDVNIIEGVEFFCVNSLKEAYEFILGIRKIDAIIGKKPAISKPDKDYDEDFSDVVGREEAKRAIEIAVSGFHHIMFSGPPGCGKSMMAKRIPTVLPEMNYDEMLEVTKLYSIYGMEGSEGGIVGRRPFRAPGTNISVAAMIGGGTGIPKPGELTLSHCGVLFLDEMPEFRRDVLESMRQPIEDERISISRASGKVTYPCKFMLVAAKNPCPCGYYGDPKNRCKCSALQIKKYAEKISGPIMDRIDIFVDFSESSGQDFSVKGNSGTNGKSSSEMKKVIDFARGVQKERYKNENIEYNSQLKGGLLKKYCSVDGETENFYEMSCQKLKISKRGSDKLLRVARTIADIDGEEIIKLSHIAEAIRFRRRDNE